MLLKRLLSEEQRTDKMNGEEGVKHCSILTDSRQKEKEEISKNTSIRKHHSACK